MLLVGGAIGAPTRYLVDGAVQDRIGGTFPWGTFVVNVTGSLVLGIVTGLDALPRARRRAAGRRRGGVLRCVHDVLDVFVRDRPAARGRSSSGRPPGNALGSIVAGLLAAGVGLAVTAAL